MFGMRAFAVLCPLLLGALAWGADGPGKPNVILVPVDDLGWGDLPFCPDLTGKGPQIPTLRLADMARNGVLLSRHYTAAPVCAPARASLFSGVHQGHAEEVRNNCFDAALENSHTLASVLREAGYATALHVAPPDGEAVPVWACATIHARLHPHPRGTRQAETDKL